MNVRMDIFTTKKNCSMDIVVVGACFCDLQTYVDRYPTPGETILGRKFQMDFGGKGANTCVMAAKLGAKTSMVSVVGDDVLGKETLANFVKFGVNTECLGTATEVATAMTNCSKYITPRKKFGKCFKIISKIIMDCILTVALVISVRH